MKLKDKTVVVTGGGDGIGRQLVVNLIDRGARVAAVDIRPEALEETSALVGTDDKLVTLVGDVTNREAVETLPRDVTAAFGSVDGVINNAGIIQPFVKLHELGYDAIERVINVNLYGTIHVVKAFLPHLLARPVAHVANVSSMGGFLPVPGQTIYGAAKAGVRLMTEGLYAELLDTNVKVSVVFPGAVATEITTHSGVDVPGDETAAEKARQQATSPEDAAGMILDGIEKDRFHIYVGRDSRTMNLINRVAPRRSTHMIYRQMKRLLE